MKIIFSWQFPATSNLFSKIVELFRLTQNKTSFIKEGSNLFKFCKHFCIHLDLKDI